MDSEHIFADIADYIEDADVPWTETVKQDYHVIVYRDRYPVTNGHLLYVPKYNTISVLMDAFNDAVQFGKRQVETGIWDGFNVGMNYGSAAGQTVPWPHVHLIPRRHGDVADPVGGVRGVISGQANYYSPGYKSPDK
jgi:diadenosine tetraphosphate (Ap4A) HIT family hydrolase